MLRSLHSDSLSRRAPSNRSPGRPRGNLSTRCWFSGGCMGFHQYSRGAPPFGSSCARTGAGDLALNTTGRLVTKGWSTRIPHSCVQLQSASPLLIQAHPSCYLPFRIFMNQHAARSNLVILSVTGASTIYLTHFPSSILSQISPRVLAFPISIISVVLFEDQYIRSPSCRPRPGFRGFARGRCVASRGTRPAEATVAFATIHNQMKISAGRPRTVPSA
jgi:hypothetical protein